MLGMTRISVCILRAGGILGQIQSMKAQVLILRGHGGVELIKQGMIACLFTLVDS